MILLRLQSFSAYGFKSFAERIDVGFDAGITAIVGPNGSGKSNIADAIRWVLGEQSIRSLRGNKMEDVIFAGSGKRRALGVAEVALTFDNAQKTLPLDFAEVTVSRRLFRSGESEYTINRSPCRLKDIHELFSDTGLGKGALAIIGQNKIDEILNSRPEERRALFEEAAGIARFKLRKREAEKKLEETAANLVRIQDIKAALEEQLEPLAENAERARRYFELEADWRACLITLAAGDIERLEAECDALATGLSGEQAQADDLSGALAAQEAAQEAAILEVALADKQCQAVQAALHEQEAQAGQLAAQQQVLEERTKQSREADERLTRERERVALEYDAAAGQLAKFAEERAAWQAGLQEKQHELQAAQANRSRVGQALRHLEEKTRERQEAVFQTQHEAVAHRNEIRAAEKEQQQLTAALARCAREHEAGETALAHSRQALQAAEAEIATVQEQAKQAHDQQAQLTGSRQALLARQQTEAKAERQLQDQYAAVNARRTLLGNMQREYEGYARSIRVLLKAEEGFRADIHGTVADVIEVPDTYVTAAEIALGGALQHVVTATDDAAKKGIAFLKRQQAGRATFLPLSTIQPGAPRPQELQAAQEPGILGRLSDFIDCAARYRSVVEFLVGRTLLAESIEAALACAKKHQFRVRIVTLEGDLVNPGGSMSGGSHGKRDTGLLSRQSALAEASAQLNRLEQDLAQLRNDKMQGQRLLAELEQQLEATRQAQNSAQGLLIQAQSRADYLLTETQRLHLQVAVAASETKQHEEARLELARRIQQANAALAALEERQRTAATEDRAVEAQRQALQAEQETAITAAMAAETAYQTARQRGEWIESRWRELAGEVEKRRGEVAALMTEQAELARLREETTAQLAAVAAQQAASGDELAQLRQAREQAEQAKLAQLVQQKQLENKVREERRRQADAQRRLHELEMRLTRAQFQLNAATEQLQAQTNLSVEEAKAFPKRDEPPAVLKEAVARLEAEIKTLGPVNPSAVQDYEQAHERYQFLAAQQEDLLSARRSLAEVIAAMDKTMTTQFEEAFAAINAHFATCFARLFGGGVARLLLADPKDVLGSGVDITVQPPGKKMQHLALLSGGERALTVIALLFAVLLYKPSPFCVLDEIDAALDEANVDRFAQFLGELAGSTQFIVITHRKGTMEAANVLHGVTMEESGVSRLLSVKMEEERPKEAVLNGIF